MPSAQPVFLRLATVDGKRIPKRRAPTRAIPPRNPWAGTSVPPRLAAFFEEFNRNYPNTPITPELVAARERAAGAPLFA